MWRRTCSVPVAEAWLEDFHKDTKKLGKRILGLDNWTCQSGDDFQDMAKKFKIKLAYTPGDTTDAGLAVTDNGPGNEIKKRVTGKYKKDLESSEERLNAWKNGKVSAAERRILFTKWLGEAWEDYSTNCQNEITAAFKKAGMYNDMDGLENHLVKLPGLKGYQPPLKDDPLPSDVPTKKRKRKINVTEKAKKRK